MTLGIDTSCYTTSVCAIEDGRLISDRRTLLKVEKGECGLRQSEAVFQHVKNLPDLMKALMTDLRKTKGAFGDKPVSIDRVCATVVPRNEEGSYMPVFNVASSFGSVCSSILGSRFVRVSHQECHIAAGVFSSDFPKDFRGEFLALHVSGGTTELLRVKRRDCEKPVLFEQDLASENGRVFKDEGFYDVKIVGGTNDLNAGQFIDRVGVAMGLGFPAGPQLERLALEHDRGDTDHALDRRFRMNPSVKGTYLSFSGPESAARRQIESGNYDSAQIAFSVQQCVCDSISRICIQACKDYDISKVLVVGGVASNGYIREKFEENLRSALSRREGSLEVFFARPELSSDNAVGAAYIGSQVDFRKGE